MRGLFRVPRSDIGHIVPTSGHSPQDSTIPGNGRPKVGLVKMYESRQRTVVSNEQVFPKGAQYKAFKAVTNILRTVEKAEQAVTTT